MHLHNPLIRRVCSCYITEPFYNTLKRLTLLVYFGSLGWICTTAIGFRVQGTTVIRQGNELSGGNIRNRTVQYPYLGIIRGIGPPMHFTSCCQSYLRKGCRLRIATSSSKRLTLDTYPVAIWTGIGLKPRLRRQMVPQVGSAPTSSVLQTDANLFQLLRGIEFARWVVVEPLRPLALSIEYHCRLTTTTVEWSGRGILQSHSLVPQTSVLTFTLRPDMVGNKGIAPLPHAPEACALLLRQFPWSEWWDSHPRYSCSQSTCHCC